MSNLRRRLLAAFQTEQRDHLEQLRLFLDALESDKPLTSFQFQEAFRSAHTLKGAARAVNLTVLESVAHQLESLFSKLKEGTLQPSPALASILREVFDVIEDYAGSPNVEERDPPLHLVGVIQQVLGQQDSEKAAVSSLPREEETPAQSFSAGLHTVRIPIPTLEGLSDRALELRVEAWTQMNSGQGLQSLAERLLCLEQDWSRLRRRGMTGAFDETALIDLQLHQCLRAARSLLVDQARHQSALNRLGQAMESQVRQARMVPAADTLGDLGPIARDLARSQGKLLDFRSKGLEIPVDRQVLGKLREPLLHMIRNAVDHGLESPDERQKLGKNPTGRLELELRVVRNRLFTTLTDDGRGVDLEKVRSKALSKGLQVSDDEQVLLALLFMPEFTTVTKASKLSGRGLGLSILQQIAQQLQGRPLISRAQPWGTVVGLETPLSVMVQSLLLLRCHEQVFALPTSAVVRLLRLDPAELKVLDGRSNYLDQGSPIPAVDLAEFLSLPGTGVQLEDGKLWTALIRIDKRACLLAVDGFLSHREAVVSALDIPGYENPKLSGMFLLEDESVCLVLNPTELLKASKRQKAISGTERKTSPQELSKVKVLVVDDSITTRMLERNILETHGYEVLVAVDGEDALRQLRTHQVDLVISDVQMPRLDGFGLLTAIKADPSLRHLPVILLTSCEDRVDRERGLDLGAEAYLDKQSFDQDGLLETVRQIA